MTTLSREDFLAVMQCWPAGVSVLTFAGAPPHGLTVSSFTSVSADPPVLTACIGAKTASAKLAEVGVEVGMNLLAADQREISDRFAWEKDGDRFALGAWQKDEGHAPVLRDGVAWMRGKISAIHPVGSHLLLLIEPAESTLGRPTGSAPLVYWNRGYRELAKGD